MEDLGGALDHSNNPGAHPRVPGESLVRVGSQGKNRRDPVADALVAAQTPLVERGQLDNPERPSGRVCSRGRGGDSPRCRVGAVAGAKVVDQLHEEGRPTRGGHMCVPLPTAAHSIMAVVVAWRNLMTRVLSTMSMVEVSVIIGITVGARRPVGLAVLLICLYNRWGG